MVSLGTTFFDTEQRLKLTILAREKGAVRGWEL
jgi:hypothetical protein